MNVWRICSAKFKSSAFTGKGAEKTGGRWNHKGYPVVYASENLSLAVLELFVHVSSSTMPNDLISICGWLPDSVSTDVIEASMLPKNWRQYPAPFALQTIGTDWLRKQSSLILFVPSAINAQENNVLLNPAHPDINKLKIENEQPFHFDPRMFDV